MKSINKKYYRGYMGTRGGHAPEGQPEGHRAEHESREPQWLGMWALKSTVWYRTD